MTILECQRRLSACVCELGGVPFTEATPQETVSNARLFNNFFQLLALLAKLEIHVFMKHRPSKKPDAHLREEVGVQSLRARPFLHMQRTFLRKAQKSSAHCAIEKCIAHCTTHAQCAIGKCAIEYCIAQPRHNVPSDSVPSNNVLHDPGTMCHRIVCHRILHCTAQGHLCRASACNILFAVRACKVHSHTHTNTHLNTRIPTHPPTHPHPPIHTHTLH